MDQPTSTTASPALAPGLAGRVSGLLARRPVILQLFRFAAIGVLNTTLDFLVLNFLSKTTGVSSGLKLGLVNIVGFSLAVVQSYLWNRYWAFGSEQAVSLWKNFTRLAAVGAVGAIAFLLVLFGAQMTAPPVFYLIILAIFVVAQVVLWQAFGLGRSTTAAGHSQQFVFFLLVSIVGLLINSGLIALVTQYVTLTDNADLNKNLAKILATFASLAWNFVGYKIFVFKR